MCAISAAVNSIGGDHVQIYQLGCVQAGTGNCMWRTHSMSSRQETVIPGPYLFIYNKAPYCPRVSVSPQLFRPMHDGVRDNDDGWKVEGEHIDSSPILSDCISWAKIKLLSILVRFCLIKASTLCALLSILEYLELYVCDVMTVNRLIMLTYRINKHRISMDFRCMSYNNIRSKCALIVCWIG